MVPATEQMIVIGNFKFVIVCTAETQRKIQKVIIGNSKNKLFQDESSE